MKFHLAVLFSVISFSFIAQRAYTRIGLTMGDNQLATNITPHKHQSIMASFRH